MIRIKQGLARGVLSVSAVLGAVAAGALIPATASVAALGQPNAFVEDLSNKMLNQLKADPKAKSGDLNRISDMVETTLMPNVDFERMTALSVGRPWRTATPEQKQQLMAEYKKLLIRTYSGAFSSITNQTIQMKPFRGEVKQDDVLVRSEVVQPGGEPLQLDYRLEQNGGNWQVYDVNVAGVWLVQTYRNQFSQQVASGGIDGLIKSLAEKNASARAGNTK